jgi:bacterioferritin-associated ferredoxin
MMVCLCQGVTERRVRREIEHGATTIDELAARCGAGACCCGCPRTLDTLLTEHVAVAPVPRRRPARLRLA